MVKIRFQCETMEEFYIILFTLRFSVAGVRFKYSYAVSYELGGNLCGEMSRVKASFIVLIKKLFVFSLSLMRFVSRVAVDRDSSKFGNPLEKRHSSFEREQDSLFALAICLFIATALQFSPAIREKDLSQIPHCSSQILYHYLNLRKYCVRFREARFHTVLRLYDLSLYRFCSGLQDLYASLTFLNIAPVRTTLGIVQHIQ